MTPGTFSSLRIKKSMAVAIVALACLVPAGDLAAASGPDPSLPKCPPDWKVEVIAKNPRILHPTALAVSPDGRVFVGQDPMDMGARGDVPIDSILCFHPDGRVTLFATNLYPVFGMVYMDGKLYVHNCPRLVVYRDDDGVGKDPVELIAQTHPNPSNNGGLNDHIPANMRLAMDGYFYMSTGDKGIYGAVGRDGSKAELHGGGLMRLRPDGTELEVYSTGTRNHLDVAITAEDQMFTYDNTDDGNGWWTRVTHMVDGGFYGYPYDYKPRQPYTLWMMADYGGGSPTGGLAYNEDALPEEYRGNLFMSEWGKKQLVRFRLSPKGASYDVYAREEFLTSGAEEFRPLGIGISPDGTGFYLADWNVGGWKKPDVAGRLLKITYTGRSLAQSKPAWYLPAAMGRPFEATTGELVQGLRHPAQSVRLTAQRRLAERGPSVVPALKALLADQQAPSHSRWHAVWTLDAVDGGKSARKELLAALDDRDDSLRAQVIRQLGTRRVAEAAPKLARMLADPVEKSRDNADRPGVPGIRFQAATALGRMADPGTIPQLLKALDESDPLIRYAVFMALNRIGRAVPATWPAIARGLTDENTAIRGGTLFAMRETYLTNNVGALAAFVRNPGGDLTTRQGALEMLAELHHQRPAWDGRWWATQPVKSPPPAKTVAWEGTEAVLMAIRETLSNSAPELRLAAVHAVETARDAECVQKLISAFDSEPAQDVRLAIVHTLGSLGTAAAEPLIAKLLSQPNPQPRTAVGSRTAANWMELILNEAIRAAGLIPGKQTVPALIAMVARPASTNQLLQVVAALGQTRSAEAVPSLTVLLRDSRPGIGIAANESLQQIGGNAVRDAITPLLDDPNPQIRRYAVATAGALRNRSLIPALLKAFADSETRGDAILSLARTPSMAALDAYLAGLEDRNSKIRDDARRAIEGIRSEALPAIEDKHRQKPFAGQALTELHRAYERDARARNGPLFEGASKPTEPEAYNRFAEKNRGSVNNGRRVFSNLATAACVKCHRVGSEGGDVGPDLSSVGAKYNRTQLIESVLYPSRQILDGYHQTVVATKDGESTSGILRQETGESITLADADGKLHAIPKGQILARKESELSLMPEGLQLALSLQEFTDLVSYLESLKENKPAGK
jgi:putative heme-binding domain-containing protein